MDTCSHALLGIAVAGLSGQPFSLSEPIYLASIIGAQAPDFDVIALARGKFALLRQHRAFSHSIPGLLMWSSLITAGFALASPATALAEVFIWSLLGGLSHIIMDFFNAHGAAVLWPLCRQRKSFGLLNVFDPLLLIIMLAVFIPGLSARGTSLLFFAATGLYIGIRLILKIRATNGCKHHFDNNTIKRMLLMPALKSTRFWDFVIESNNRYYVGQISVFEQALTIHAELPKKSLSPAVQGAQKTTLGEFFSSFTPFSYFTEYQDHQHQAKLVQIYDLRYFFNETFLHSATIILGSDDQPCASYIKTYGQKINIPC